MSYVKVTWQPPNSEELWEKTVAAEGWTHDDYFFRAGKFSVATRYVVTVEKIDPADLPAGMEGITPPAWWTPDENPFDKTFTVTDMCP